MPMNKSTFHWYTRRAHRYLGIILGVQFLAWTVGGLYFSWTNIESIRGEPLRKEAPLLHGEGPWAPLSEVISGIKNRNSVDGLVSVQLIEILDKPYYQIVFQSDGKERVQLADGRSGALRPPLTRKEAIALAQSRLVRRAEIKGVAYLTQTSAHHEYREKPLPAYAVQFGAPVNTMVYVSAELGTVQSFRSTSWRVFDFLWMMHTMDYQGRDNFNNWLLRIFSLFGLVTIFSGFLLFWISSRKLNRLK